MKLPKKYFSIDVEANGQYPWNSSMLSFGACVVDGKFDRTFYAELKPIRDDYLLENFKKGASKLNCLEDYNHSRFHPEDVLDILKEKGQRPELVMPYFAEWIQKNSKGYQPRLVSDNNLFDGSFIFYYLSNFNDNKNPFGYSSDSMNTGFRFSVRNMEENIKNLRLKPNENHTHKAIDDAIEQGIKFYNALKHIGHKF